MSGPTYAVGIVSYQSYEDLAACLESIAAQAVAPAAVYVIDADPDPAQHALFAAQYEAVTFEASSNLGYAGGANRILTRIAAEHPEVDFCLLMNPDVSLERDFARRLIDAVAERPEVALATGKLLRPDGRTIDSAGIDLPSHRRPRDRGSEQADRGQLDAPADVFAASGAALLIRMKALADLELDGEIFDEDFFMYHEDTDLCWRAQRLGWRVRYEPSARATHARGWQRHDRFAVPPAVRRHSFKNHYLQVIKNERPGDFARRLPVLLVWEVLRLGFAVLKDREMLSAYPDAWRLSARAFHKRRLLDAKTAGRPPRSLRGQRFDGAAEIRADGDAL